MYPVSHDLNFSNRPVRTRMPGGVAGAQPLMAAPYADLNNLMKRGFGFFGGRSLIYPLVGQVSISASKVDRSAPILTSRTT